MNKRIIKIKDARLQNLRYNLRKLLILESKRRLKEISDNWKRIWWDNDNLPQEPSKLERIQSRGLQTEMSSIREMLNKSICICPACGSAKKDMVFNPELETWSCIECYQLCRRYYKDTIDKSLFP